MSETNPPHEKSESQRQYERDRLYNEDLIDRRERQRQHDINELKTDKRTEFQRDHDDHDRRYIASIPHFASTRDKRYLRVLNRMTYRVYDPVWKSFKTDETAKMMIEVDRAELSGKEIAQVIQQNTTLTFIKAPRFTIHNSHSEEPISEKEIIDIRGTVIEVCPCFFASFRSRPISIPYNLPLSKSELFASSRLFDTRTPVFYYKDRLGKEKGFITGESTLQEVHKVMQDYDGYDELASVTFGV